MSPSGKGSSQGTSVIHAVLPVERTETWWNMHQKFPMHWGTLSPFQTIWSPLGEGRLFECSSWNRRKQQQGMETSCSATLEIRVGSRCTEADPWHHASLEYRDFVYRDTDSLIPLVNHSAALSLSQDHAKCCILLLESTNNPHSLQFSNMVSSSRWRCSQRRRWGTDQSKYCLSVCFTQDWTVQYIPIFHFGIRKSRIRVHPLVLDSLK